MRLYEETTNILEVQQEEDGPDGFLSIILQHLAAHTSLVNQVLRTTTELQGRLLP